MSIKKLAKSINNLADAIRYHANMAANNTLPSGGDTFSTNDRIESECHAAEGLKARTEFEEAIEGLAKFKKFAIADERAAGVVTGTGFSYKNPQHQNVPKYEGKETEHCLSAGLTEAEANFVDPYDAPPKATVTDAGWVLPPQPKAEAIAVVKKLDDLAPPKLNDPKFMAGFSEGLVPAFQTSDGKSLNDAPPPKTPHLASERDETPMVDPAPMPTEKPELSQEKPGQVPMSNAQLIFKKDAPGWQTLTVEELDAAPSVEVDADGLPWDERIHSGGKTLLVDGTWRLKRGVPDDEYQEVVAELKKLMAIPAPDTVTATLSPTKPVELGKPVDNTPPPPPNASAPVPPAPRAAADNLPVFIKAVTGAQLDKDVVLAAVKNAGLENVMQLGARPDLIAGIAKELGL